MTQRSDKSISDLPVIAEYEIQVMGILDSRWSRWFGDVELMVDHTDEQIPLTTIRCPAVDQVKLRGMLNQIWDLNLDLIAVRRLPATTNKLRTDPNTEDSDE